MNPSRYNGNAYLFLRELEVDSSGAFQFPEMFWASDRQGTQRWSDDETDERLLDLGLMNAIELKVENNEYSWDWFVYDAIRDLQKMRGFNPNTTELADYLGLPHLEIDPTVLRFQGEWPLHIIYFSRRTWR